MFTLSVILSLATGITANSWIPKTSAASNAQIRFAIENKYDSTGPGAKTPEFAYKTYKTLNEALVAYVDDPDTQLPEAEKQKALHKLTRPIYNKVPPYTSYPRFQPKTVDEYTGYKPELIKNQNNPVYASYKLQNVIQQNNVVNDYTGWKSPQLVENPKQHIKETPFYKPQTLNTKIVNQPTYLKKHNSYGFGAFGLDHQVGNDNSLGHYTADVQDFDPNPQYSFSYGVHDKGTGDSKSAHESRNGGAVRGFYTFMDADGKQRTVHYTADDKFGFRASVQRTHINSQ